VALGNQRERHGIPDCLPSEANPKPAPAGVGLRTTDGRTGWGKRSCVYFVFDPATGQFAPSKFCAYTPVGPAGDRTSTPSEPHRMTVGAYADLNDGTHVMDGNRAWQHLVRCLGMRAVTAGDSGPVAGRFDEWLTDYGQQITVRGGSPTFLIPPAWYLSSVRILCGGREATRGGPRLCRGRRVGRGGEGRREPVTQIPTADVVSAGLNRL
jgi:hypothetical protein